MGVRQLLAQQQTCPVIERRLPIDAQMTAQRALAAGFQENGLASDFAAQCRPEQLPSFALKPSELHLFDRREIDRAGVDRDAGQQVGGPEILEVCGLFHHVLACEVVAALL